MDTRALEAIKDLARRHGDATTVREAQWLGDRLRTNELTVLVAGQFKRGKSTFINALLGEELLPTGALPLTSVATMIHYGQSARAIVGFLDGGSMQIAVADVRQYVTEAENPENRLRVARVDVEIPVNLLKGVRLVDTPGIASTFVHNTNAAREAVREADLAILVVGPEPPIGEAEIAFAREIRDAAERLFVVYNKADVLLEQQNELVEFTKAQLQKALGFDPHVFTVSAKEALHARKAGTEDARFREFVADFWRFLDRHRDVILERSLRNKCAALGKRLETMLRLRRHALLLPAVERRTATRRFEDLSKEVRRRAEELQFSLERALRSVARRIDDLLEERFRQSRASLTAALSASADAGDPRSFESDLERAAADEASSWLTAVAETIDAQMRDQAEILLERVAELEREILQRGLEAVNMHETIPKVAMDAFDLPGISLPRERIADTGLEIVVKGGMNVLPRTVRAGVLRRQLPESVRERLDARRGRLRHAAHRELDRIAKELAAAAGRRLVAAEAAVRTALDEAAGVDDAAICSRAAALESDAGIAARLAVELSAGLAS